MPTESTGQKTVTFTTAAGSNLVVGTSSVVTGGTTLASGATTSGRLNAVLFSGSTGSGPYTIYDNVSTNSGAVIGYLLSSSAAGTFQAYDIPYFKGINVYDAGSGGMVMTVVYTIG